MGWRDDPVVATQQASGGWQNDPVVTPAPQGRTPSIIDPLRDTAEAGLKAVGGALGYTAGNIAGLAGIVGNATGVYPNDPAETEQKVASAFAVTPTNPDSWQSKLVDLPGRLIGGAGEKLSQVPGIKGTPYIEDIARRAPEALANAAGAAAGLKARAAPKAAPAPVGSPQSVGASAAAADLMDASPELRTAVEKARQSGAANDEVAARHLDADTLPVRVQLMEGQATQDPALISRDMNNRGKNKAIADRVDLQNKQLGQNVEAIRNEVGEQVFSTNPVEHGDTILADYAARDKAAQADITAKYKALNDANGGQFPVDAPKLLSNVREALKRETATDHAPKEIMRTISRFAKNNDMTFENYEALRTNLARIQRSATADGNMKHAAGVIRQSLEDLPLNMVSEASKQLADVARSASKARFDAIEADPAYKASVEGVPPDRFVQKFVISAPRDDVATMFKSLAPGTQQTVRVAVVDYLRQQARLNSEYGGNFSAPGFNKALTSLDPKLQILFDAKTVESLRKLGRVADYTTAQPRGSYVNNSNTFVAGAAAHAAQAAEGMANVAAFGVPVGTWTGNAIRAAKSGKTLKPGAGVRNPSK